MTNYNPFINSLNGIQNKYIKAFLKEYGSLIKDSNAFIPKEDNDGEFHSEVYNVFKRTFDDFQNPFVITGFELGKAIYKSNRDFEEKKLNKTFPVFNDFNISKKLLEENVLNYWTVVGLLKKVDNGSASVDWVGSVGARGIADLTRNSTIEAGVKDSGLKKKAKVALQGNACEFCISLANKINNSSTGFFGRKISWHERCNCAIYFEYEF